MIKFKPEKNIIMAVSIVILIFLFLAGTGTLTSGFHFVDDHEVLTINKELSSNSWLSVAAKWLRTDIKGIARFRPVYIIHRVLETKIFGTNFRLWSIYNGFLFSIAVISFFLAARKLRFSILYSLVFVIAIFIGPQAAIMWRLGPGEGLAMAFLGLSFLFMALSIGSSGAGKYNILFIFFLILASFTKESFLLAVPAVLFLKISVEARNGKISLFRAAFRNSSLLIPLIIMAAGMLYIFLVVGTGNASSGQGLGSMIGNVIFSILKIGKIFLYPLILITIIFIFRGVVGRADYLTLMIEPFVFMLLLAIPNIILYSSTGLEERYLLPATTGFAYLMISILVSFNVESPFLRKVVVVASFLVFVPQFISTAASATDFSNDGHETGILLKAITGNAVKGKSVLLIADPVESYELSVSLKTWLAVTCDIQLLGYALVKENETEGNKIYVDGWNSYFRGNLFTINGSPPGLVIFLDKGITKRFAASSVLDFEGNYKLDTETAHFALYELKQNSVGR